MGPKQTSILSLWVKFLASRGECSQIVLVSDLQVSLPLLYVIVRFAIYLFHCLLIQRQSLYHRMNQAGRSLEVESLEGCHVNNCVLWWERHICGDFVLCLERMIALIYTLIVIRCSGSETGIASNG